MKLTVVPNSLDNLDKYMKIGADAFIFGLKGYCSGYNLELTLDEIKEIRKLNSNIEMFISINKNIFNSELEELERILIELDKLNIQGILFYDLSLLNIKLKNNLKIDLVWNQTHMVTNYNTCNYYYEKGVKYGVLAGEITLDEIKEIKEKTKMSLFVNVFGYPIMSYTRRHLLNHYFISNKKSKEKDRYTITNNGESYLIKEESKGNSILFGKLLNGSVIIPEIDLDYVILNEDGVDSELFIKVLELFKRLIDTKDNNLIKDIDSLIGDYRGFFFQKTIYKVKRNG